MLIGFKAFKSYHWKHHAGVGSSSDPEMYHRVRAWRIYDRFGLGGAAVYYLLGFGAWDVITLYAKLRPAALEDYIGLACFIMLAFFLPAPVIMTLVLSTFTSFMCVFQVRGYTEHRGTLTFYKTKPALWKRLVFLPHGTWLHWEHHRWPGTDLNELYQRHLENLDLQWSRDVIK
jgi:fatty acid desaturase